MPILRHRTHLPGCSPDDLWSWHMRPGAFERLVPPWQRLTVDHAPETLEDGAVARFRVHIGPARWPWEAHHRAVQEPHGFVDVARRGPFGHWEHAHRFLAAKRGGAWLEDEVSWAPPAGPLGWPLTRPLRTALDAMFRYRHRVTALDLEDHARHASSPSQRIGITGASGLVGRALSAYLTTGGHRIVPIVRGTPRDGEIGWDPTGAGIEPRNLQGLDAVVHLAGEPIAGRWTADKKRRIVESRVEGTTAIAEAMAACRQGPRTLVSASACGYYGHQPSGVVDESTPSGEGFLAETAKAWEDATEPARAAGIRVVTPRFGLVISGRGGVLSSMLPAFRFGLGGPIGRGAQGFPWVSIDDLSRMIHQALLDPDWSGPFNAVGPTPTSQRAFARALGQAVRRPAILPVPTAVLRALGGQAAEELLLGGQRAEAGVLRARGFRWRDPDLVPLLRQETGDPEEAA